MGLLATKKVLLKAAHHPGFVGPADEIVFQSLFLQCRALALRVLRQIGLAILPQKMQIDRVENHATLRRVESNIRNVSSGNITAAQNNEIKRSSLHFEVFAHAPDVGMVSDFDPAFLKVIGVGRDTYEIIRDEGYPMAKSL